MLEHLFGSRLRYNVLSWILTHPDDRYYVRQLHRILNADSTNLSRELANLEKLGIVKSTVEGRQKYYQADKACHVFPELSALMRRGDETLHKFVMRSRLTDAIESWAGRAHPANDALDSAG